MTNEYIPITENKWVNFSGFKIPKYTICCLFLVISILTVSCREEKQISSPISLSDAQIVEGKSDDIPPSSHLEGAPSFSLTVVNSTLVMGDVPILIGILENNTSQHQTNILLELTLHDEEGRDEGVYTGTSLLEIIPAGAQSPFILHLPDFVNTMNIDYSLVVNSEVVPSDFSDEIVSSMSLTNDARIVTHDNGRSYVMGTLKNGSDQPLLVNDLSATVGPNDHVRVGRVDARAQLVLPHDSVAFQIAISGDSASEESQFGLFYYLTNHEDPNKLQILLDSTKIDTYVDSMGNYHLVGEAYNAGPDSVLLTLMGSIYTSEGLLLDFAQYSSPVYTLLPGRSLAFDFSDFPIISNDITSARAISSSTVVVDKVRTKRLDFLPQELTIEDVEVIYTNPLVQVRGLVRNNSGAEVGYPVIAITLRDSSGRIVGVDYHTLPSTMSHGETLEFGTLIAQNNQADVTELIAEVHAQAIPTKTD